MAEETPSGADRFIQERHARSIRDKRAEERKSPEQRIEEMIDRRIEAAISKLRGELKKSIETPFQDSHLLDLRAIKAYDTDESTVLRTGAVYRAKIAGTFYDFAAYKIEWCKDSVPGKRYALLSPFVAD